MAQKKTDDLPPLADTLQPAQPGEVLELDELWSYVGSHRKTCWIWLALCRRTRQIVAYALGCRGDKTAKVLWSRIPESYRSSLLMTDYWESYANVLPQNQHFPVSKATGQTAHIERFNNTLRQRLAPLVRKTLSFSKSIIHHESSLRLFLHHYNLACSST